MRKLYFLVPGTTRQFRSGGLWAELKTVELAQKITSAQAVTYRQREQDTPFLKDLLQHENLADCIFVVSWGFDVPQLVKQLNHCHVVYHAHSAGYGFRLPPRIPIVTVSRNTLSYWGQKSPNSPIYYLPNQISAEFRKRGLPRDIDVLVQTRKSSNYLLRQLVPALRRYCQVQLLDRYVDDLAGLFNRAKVYLYDSAEYWAVSGVTEGFGLPPLEALACGCQVFSSVNSGLGDYLDPGVNCQKIATYSLAYDLHRIRNAVEYFERSPLPDTFFAPYRGVILIERLRVILQEINTFFDLTANQPPDIAGLSPWRIRQLWLKQTLAKVKRKLTQS